MKRVAAILSIVTFFCSSLVWGSPENQMEIISKMNALLESKETAHQESECIYNVYKTLEDSDFSFIPVYEISTDWRECLTEFVEKELGLNLEDLELDDDRRCTILLTKADDSKIKIQQTFSADHAVEIIRSSHLLSLLDLQHLRIPKIIAVARIRGGDDDWDRFLLASEVNNDKSLFSYFLGSPLDFFLYGKNKWEETMTDIFFQLGLATGELFIKSSELAPIHPLVKAQRESNLNRTLESLQNNSFMGFSDENLLEKFELYQNNPNNTPICHCYHIRDSLSHTYTYDRKTNTLSIKDPSTLLWTIDTKKRPITSQSEAYFIQIETILNTGLSFSSQETETFKAAFDRGYVKSGCALPTAEEEEIYRFFEGLSSLEEVISDDNLQWLWEQCQAE